MTRHTAFQKLELPCFHCKKHEETHENGKCLFEATTFRSMTEEEWARWSMLGPIDLGAIKVSQFNPLHLSTSRSLTEQDIVQAHSLLTRQAWFSKK